MNRAAIRKKRFHMHGNLGESFRPILIICCYVFHLFSWAKCKLKGSGVIAEAFSVGHRRLAEMVVQIRPDLPGPSPNYG